MRHLPREIQSDDKASHSKRLGKAGFASQQYVLLSDRLEENFSSAAQVSSQ
jgi:hypothetical protein